MSANKCLECGESHQAWESCKKRNSQTNELLAKLACVDVVFVIDTTSSMGPWIAEARKQAKAVADAIIADGNINAQFSVIEYRDHPPQDNTFVTRKYDFGSSSDLQSVLDKLQPWGGGDEPEAVWDGVDLATKAAWRDQSDRQLYLIGDSPPHGMKTYDYWPQGCPCGLTVADLTKGIKENNIVFHAIVVGPNKATEKSFSELASSAGGDCIVAQIPEEMIVKFRSDLTSSSSTIKAANDYVNLCSAGPCGPSGPMGPAGPVPDAIVAATLNLTEDELKNAKTYIATRGIKLPESAP